MPVKLNIDVGYWNIRGLFRREGAKKISKFTYEEVMDQIKAHDIFCFSETHINESVNIKVPGYRDINLPRKRSKKATKDSGGLAVYIKYSVRPGVTVIPSKSREHVWLKLKKDFFQTKDNVFVCYAYANPDNSTYNSEI